MPVNAGFVVTSLLRARGGISIDVHGGITYHELFSAHAEVFPRRSPHGPIRRALLRARGGISGSPSYTGGSNNSSPRTRRYFRAQGGGLNDNALFSAHAEVFPVNGKTSPPLKALLRARGGISEHKAVA